MKELLCYCKYPISMKLCNTCNGRTPRKLFHRGSYKEIVVINPEYSGKTADRYNNAVREFNKTVNKQKRKRMKRKV